MLKSFNKLSLNDHDINFFLLKSAVNISCSLSILHVNENLG